MKTVFAVSIAKEKNKSACAQKHMGFFPLMQGDRADTVHRAAPGTDQILFPLVLATPRLAKGPDCFSIDKCTLMGSAVSGFTS